MKKSLRIFPVTFVCMLILALDVCAQQVKDITPKPVSAVMLNGEGATLHWNATILADSAFWTQANYLGYQLFRQCGWTIRLGNPEGRVSGGTIMLRKENLPEEKPEAYVMEIKDGQVLLRAGDERGIVNGVQTLLQLLPLNKADSVVLPACRIDDYPRFTYRGMHLDVVRHMFPLEYIKKYIDYLAFHKFNTFHWHLTDDQGWRIEILSYPKLNSIGSWRDSTLIGHFRDSPAIYDRSRYGGYYTRAEIQQVITYAAVRAITVIPEIDIPGHSRATITAYPAFSTDPSNAWGVAATWGMYNRQNNVLAPNEETFRFLRAVFHEIADLFPSPYIHLGGDECSKLWWKQSPSTQAFMKQKGLKDEATLQTYFIEQVSSYLREKNKKVIGWHEIMEGKLDTSTIVMNWSNDAKAIEAAGKGFQVIQTPGKPYYFDHYQSKDPSDSLAIHGYNPLEAVYAYDPVPPAVEKSGKAQKVIGGQANVWTEYMAYPTKVDYMVLPRMAAVSESLWSRPEQKDYKDFLERLKAYMLPRYMYWQSSWFPAFEEWGANR
jgi:hexosaminidase